MVVNGLCTMYIHKCYNTSYRHTRVMLLGVETLYMLQYVPYTVHVQHHCAPWYTLCVCVCVCVYTVHVHVSTRYTSWKADVSDLTLCLSIYLCREQP